MSDPLSTETYAALRVVYERAKRIGLLGPGPVDAHIAHAQQFFEAAPLKPLQILDLGSGAGVPGLVLAMLWGQTEMCLVDAMERRVTFLESAVEELGLAGRVQIIRGRAEELGRELDLREKFDLVVARSFAGPGVTAECGSPFARVGGALLVSEPPEGEQRWPEEGIGLFGLERNAGIGMPIAVLTKVSPINDRFPRRVGVPEKRPLF